VQELGGSTAWQIARLANGNVPYHRWHAQFMNGGCLGGRNLAAVLFTMSSNPLLFRNSNFSGSSVFLGSFKKFAKICKFEVLRSLLGE